MTIRFLSILLQQFPLRKFPRKSKDPEIWLFSREIFQRELLTLLLLFSLFVPAGSEEPIPQIQSNIRSILEPVFIAYSAKDRVYLLLFSPGGQDKGSLTIVEATKDTLEREEIASWAQWIMQDMPSALTKTSYTIEYGGKLDITSDVPSSSVEERDLLKQLLTLMFTTSRTPVPASERKKIGPHPMQDEIDRRTIWNPPIVFEGQRLSAVESEAYMMVWPEDGTEQAGKRFILYFAKGNTPLPFRIFPMWVESEGRLFLTARVIESGLLPAHTSEVCKPREIFQRELLTFTSSCKNLNFAFIGTDHPRTVIGHLGSRPFRQFPMENFPREKPYL